MTGQITLPFLSARTTDPATSVEAAKQVSGRTDREVLELLRSTGRALTADQIVAALPPCPTAAPADGLLGDLPSTEGRPGRRGR